MLRQETDTLWSSIIIYLKTRLFPIQKPEEAKVIEHVVKIFRLLTNNILRLLITVRTR